MKSTKLKKMNNNNNSNNIRVIYDFNSNKYKKQYELFIKFFNISIPFIIYIDKNTQYVNNKVELLYVQDYYKYNIFFDILSEDAIELFPSKINILIINDEYLLNNNLLRKEVFNNKPLKNLNNYIDYYFCLTKYSYDIISKIINKEKVLLTNGLIFNPKLNIVKNSDINKNFSIFSENINKSNKYIYYPIDYFSKEYNIYILDTWLTYFSTREEILIIHFAYNREAIVIEMLNLLNAYHYYKKNLYFYKNIIFFSDLNHIVVF